MVAKREGVDPEKSARASLSQSSRNARLARRGRGNTGRRLSDEERIHRSTQVVKMRRERMSYDEIGQTFDPPLSPSTVCDIYKRALANHPLTAIQIDEHRMEEIEFIDQAIRQLLKIALDEETDAQGRPMVSKRTKVEAWTSMKGWSEHKAKILGIFAPTQHQVVSLSAIDEQIIRLEAELGIEPGDKVTVIDVNPAIAAIGAPPKNED